MDISAKATLRILLVLKIMSVTLPPDHGTLPNSRGCLEINFTSLTLFNENILVVINKVRTFASVKESINY